MCDTENWQDKGGSVLTVALLNGLVAVTIAFTHVLQHSCIDH